MSCNCKKVSTPCGCQPCDPCEESIPSCSCPIRDLSTDCVLYTGERLECSGIEGNIILTDLINQLDAFICDKFSEVTRYFTLSNIGSGAEIYRGIAGTGAKELRTIVSEDTSLLDIIQNSDTIGIKAGIPSLSIEPSTSLLSFIMTTLSGSTTLSSLDLSYLNNHLNTVTYLPTTNIIRYTLIDGTEIDLNLSELVDEVLIEAADNQIQSDYLESDVTSKAYILNRNPSKTVSADYTVVLADNNYIIEIDNGTNNITIDVGGSLGTDSFFVGFVQKGTGNVTITGATQIPADLTNVIYGQGHVCALEIINGTKYLHGTLKSV